MVTNMQVTMGCAVGSESSVVEFKGFFFGISVILSTLKTNKEFVSYLHVKSQSLRKSKWPKCQKIDFLLSKHGEPCWVGMK